MHSGRHGYLRRLGHRAALSLALGPVCGAWASSDRPTVWSWLAPAGAAANHASFRHLVIMYPRNGESGTGLAQRLASEIRARGLVSDRIGVLISGFGRSTPPLAYDPGDAVPLDPAIARLSNGTPWLASGLPKARAWTGAFIAEYQRLESTTGLPAPSRFHMDCELRLPTLCYQSPDASGLRDCWDTPPVQVFDAIAADPRWSTEPVPVSLPGGVAWRTMQQLHTEGGAPAWNAEAPRNAEANRAWSRWFDAMQRSVMEGALDQALYAPVRAAWPACRTSEFAQSMRIDGAMQQDGSRRVYRDFEWWLNGWMESAWVGAADLQAPAIYAFGTSFMASDAEWVDANLRIDRANLDACLHSFGGAVPTTITPWLMLPGTALPIDATQARDTDAAMLDERVALMRWRGMREFQLWPGTSAENWTRVALAVEAVWSAETVELALVRGSAATADLAERVARADRREVTLSPDAGEIELRARVNGAAGAAGPCARDRLLVHVEGHGEAGTLFVEAAESGDPMLGWVPVGSAGVESSVSAGFHRWWLAGAGRCVASDGSITLRLRVQGGAFTIDLLQAARFAEAGPDLDGSGWIDIGDLALALLEFGPTVDSAADLDASGAVDYADIALLLLEFGPCEG